MSLEDRIKYLEERVAFLVKTVTILSNPQVQATKHELLAMAHGCREEAVRRIEKAIGDFCVISNAHGREDFALLGYTLHDIFTSDFNAFPTKAEFIGLFTEVVVEYPSDAEEEFCGVGYEKLIQHIREGSLSIEPRY